MITCLGPKRSLETSFQKNAIIPVKKDLGLSHSQITDHCRHRVTFYWAPLVFRAINMQVIRSFPQHPIGFGKNKILKKGYCSN